MKKDTKANGSMDESVRATEGSIYNNLLIRLDIDELSRPIDKWPRPQDIILANTYAPSLSD